MLNRSIILAASLILGLLAVAAASSAQAAEADIRAALQRWVNTVNTGGAGPIAALYAPDAILLATFEAKPLVTPGDIRGYFSKHPGLKVRIQSEKIGVLGGGGVDTGLYTFTDAGTDKPARFSFVFRQRTPGTTDQWLIISHHSSVVPSGH